MAARKKAKKAKKTGKAGRKKWSGRVTRESDALDLKKGVFSQKDPEKVARSLKRSAEHSHRRKSSPYRSAMSMLTSISTGQARICRHGRRRCWSRPRMNCASFSTGIETAFPALPGSFGTGFPAPSPLSPRVRIIIRA